MYSLGGLDQVLGPEELQFPTAVKWEENEKVHIELQTQSLEHAQQYKYSCFE